MPRCWHGYENPCSICNAEPGRNGLETTPQLGDESNFEALRLESGFRAKTKDSGNDQRETRRSDWKSSEPRGLRAAEISPMAGS